MCISDKPPPACLQAVPAALPGVAGGSPLGRRAALRECPLFLLFFENLCQEFPIQVAAVAQLPWDVEPGFCNNTAKRAGGWCTRLLGTVLDVNETVEGYPDINNTVFYYL